MRIYDLALFVMALSVSMNIVNYMDVLYMHGDSSIGAPAYNRTLIGYSRTAQNKTYYVTDDKINNTVSQYGIDNVPSQSTDSTFLFQGWTIMSTVKIVWDTFIRSTFGFGWFIRTTFFTSLPQPFELGISAFTGVMSLVFLVGFLRGYYFGR